MSDLCGPHKFPEPGKICGRFLAKKRKISEIHAGKCGKCGKYAMMRNYAELCGKRRIFPLPPPGEEPGGTGSLEMNLANSTLLISKVEKNDKIPM